MASVYPSLNGMLFAARIGDDTMQKMESEQTI